MQEPSKGEEWEVMRKSLVHMYFSKASALYSRLIKAAASKPPAPAKIRQASWSFEGNLLRGLDFRALVSFGGHEVEAHA